MKIFDFINHASIKTESNGLTIITDPWVISNAFGGWVQNPSPTAIDIFDIIENDEKLGVIVSHGHDDHIDDWFVSKHLNDKSFFCSKFATPGLENRLIKKNKVHTSPIGDGINFGDFTIQQFINPDFTEYDAIITIEAPEFLIIHANDNWHKWPEAIIKQIIKVVEKYSKNDVFLLIQFGVADCFPVNYDKIDEQEAISILNKRFKTYLESTETNMKSLGLQKLYYYANQSIFNYKINNLNKQSMYALAQRYLEDVNCQHTQLIPGMSVHKGHKIEHHHTSNQSIFRYCLKSLENFINDAYKKYTKVSGEKYIEVAFNTTGQNISKNRINYIADVEVWNRILIGELTLEAITIGGSGIISKPDVNIRDHHMFVSKRAYIAQNMINKQGLMFFKAYNEKL